MPFRIGNLIITVVHPHLDKLVPSPPLPPAASHRPTVPTLIDELRALLAHATARLAGGEDPSLDPPRTVTEATALVRYSRDCIARGAPGQGPARQRSGEV